MFLLILLLFVFTIFAFVVTNKGVVKVLSNRGYKEYRLSDYSNWLQNRVRNNKDWNRIRSCLVDDKFGCFKPADECNFTYKAPTQWEKPTNVSSFSNLDCGLWDNRLEMLCFDCESCKGGVLDNLKRNWKKVAIINIVILVFLIIVYSIGCCGFRDSKEDNHYPRWK
ncbi:hypothetical protein IC575_019993 [Cucumis melo]